MNIYDEMKAAGDNRESDLYVPATIKTRIHYYCFNLRFRRENLKWEQLKVDLQATHGNCFEAPRHDPIPETTVEEITLEVAQLSNNEWNSTTSRVFDWYLGTDSGTPHIRAGHWLEITEEMKALRHRAAILNKFAKATEHATTERDGMLWLLDRAIIKLDNVIYYAHTARFQFGWRTPLSPAAKEELKASLAEFPFPYDVN